MKKCQTSVFPFSALGTEDTRFRDLRTGISVDIIKYAFRCGRRVWQFSF